MNRARIVLDSDVKRSINTSDICNELRNMLVVIGNDFEELENSSRKPNKTEMSDRDKTNTNISIKTVEIYLIEK